MNKDSLRYRLLQRLLLSANIAILLFLPLIYHLFRSYAVDAYDQELSEAGFSLVPYLVSDHGQVRFTLPPEAEAAYRTDPDDENYFLIVGPGDTYIAGDHDLPLDGLGPAWRKQPPFVFYDAVYRGREIRASAYRHVMDGKVYLVVAAETTVKRERILSKILLGLILPLFVLAAVNGVAMWWGVRLVLAPLDRIRTALLDMRDSHPSPMQDADLPAEVRPLVEALNALLQRVDASAAAQQQFVANAAHQLRTPLAGVRTQLELLRTQLDSPDHQLRIGNCVDSIERLNHLIHQMLALLTASEGARGVVMLGWFDVAELIRARSDEWVRQAALRDIDLGFELASACVQGDELLAGEMLGNLIDNALRYVPEGGVVTVRCRPAAAQAIIEIEDNGPGIPEAQREKVFQRFYRIPGTNMSGSGLGLAIVHDIASGMGGTVTVTSPDGHAGCLMRVGLPLVQDDRLSTDVRQ